MSAGQRSRTWGGMIPAGDGTLQQYYKETLDLPYETRVPELRELIAANNAPDDAFLEPYDDYGDPGVRLAWRVPVPQEDIDAQEARLEKFMRDHPRPAWLPARPGAEKEDS